MPNIQLRAICKIHDGKLDEFETAARKLLAAVQEKDSGTLQYDWFFSPDRSVCVVHETYADSDAVMQHMANMGDLLRDLVKLSDLSLELFGDPSPELAAAAAAFSPTVYGYFQGL